jgi:hypothetical protein
MSMYRIIAAASIVFGFAMPYPSFAEPCPPSETTLYTGEVSPGPNWVAVNTPLLDLKPCQTAMFEVTVRDNANGNQHGVLEVQVQGENGLILFTRSAPSPVPPGGYIMTELPSLNSHEGRPLPGTIGPQALAEKIFVRANPWTTIQLQYEIKVIKTSVPGYNTGGRSFTDAPLLTLLPAEVKARIHTAEDGQYFRVRLAAGGTLKLVGTARRGNFTCCGYLRAHVYTSPTSSGTQILNKGYAYSSSPEFESSVYTNPTGQAHEFYLRISALPGTLPSAVLEDVVMQVTGTEGPRLTLYLDADSPLNFNAQQPSSDHPQYIPGSVAGGLSVNLPQVMELIAAYVNSAGQIVQPPAYAGAQVTFELSGTSRFVGKAMNAGYGDEGPDYELGGYSATFSNNDYTARMELRCLDYGGRTRVTAFNNSGTAWFDLPLDEDGNWIPDVGWKATANGQVIGTIADTHSMSFRDDDQDTNPTGSGVVGDGLINFEEYRGFIVRGEHRRTNPYQKDLFVDSTVGQGVNIGYAVNLPVTKHWVAPEDLFHHPDPLSRDTFLINPLYQNGVPGGTLLAHANQRGVLVRDHEYFVASYYGEAPCNPCTPNYEPKTNGVPDPTKPVEAAKIYSRAIDDDVPDDPSILTQAIKKTVGHELGHMVGMPHYSFQGEGTRITVMISGFFGWVNSSWTNIPTSYDADDVQWIQVR